MVGACRGLQMFREMRCQWQSDKYLRTCGMAMHSHVYVPIMQETRRERQPRSATANLGRNTAQPARHCRAVGGNKGSNFSDVEMNAAVVRGQ